MKKIAVLLICVLMLCGCSHHNSGMDQALSFRQKLLSSEQCEFDCRITADYEDSIYTFSVHCVFDHQGTMTFEVMEPQSIAGISGKMDSHGGQLTFDSNALAFPIIADGYLSPISAPWVFMKALRSGYIDACGENGDGFLLLLNDSYEEAPLQIELYTDSDFIPQRGEMLWKGIRILSLDVSNFSCL